MSKSYETESGTLEITDDELTVTGGAEDISIPLSPPPDVTFTRGISGPGALIVNGEVVPLDNECASEVVTELRRARPGWPGYRAEAAVADGAPDYETAARSDLDEATGADETAIVDQSPATESPSDEPRSRGSRNSRKSTIE